MPVVFVHGVATRRGPRYDESLIARDELLRRYLADHLGADVARVANAYWGGDAAQFRWNHASLPADGVEGFGPATPTEDVLVAEHVEGDLDSDDRVVVAAAAVSAENAFDLLWASSIIEADEETIRGLVGLAVRASRVLPTLDSGLITATDDEGALEQFDRILRAEVATEPGVESFGVDQVFDRLREGLIRVRGAAGRLAGRGATKLLRGKVHRSGALFLGDVLTYVNERGPADNPGPIATAVITEIETAVAEEPGAPLVVVAHSMGGNIVYDVLSYFRPDLACDVLVTVGSQVGLFEELCLLARGNRTAVRRSTGSRRCRTCSAGSTSSTTTTSSGSRRRRSSTGSRTTRTPPARERRWRTSRTSRCRASTGAWPAGSRADMTLVFEQDVAGPATHALIIGVGGYDHLDGGASDHKLEPAGKYGNLGQLTSPPKSACALAAALTAIPREDWLAPLGTVDLLVSTAPGDDDPGGTGGPYERATRTAIQEAFDRWWVRCESNPDNVAVFFFCGHGLQASSHVLLPTDFGATGNPWAQAIDFNRTRDAFLTNKAKTQVFLVDACREVTTSTVEVPSPNAPPLREPEVRQTNRCEHDLTVQSTSEDKEGIRRGGSGLVLHRRRDQRTAGRSIASGRAARGG